MLQIHFFLVSLRASKKFLNKLLQFCSIFWKCLYIFLCFQLCFMCFWYIWRTFMFWWKKTLAPTGTYRFGGAFGTRACILFWRVIAPEQLRKMSAWLISWPSSCLLAGVHWFQLRAFIEHVFKSTAFEEFHKKTSVLGLRAELWFFPHSHESWKVASPFSGLNFQEEDGRSTRGKINVV